MFKNIYLKTLYSQRWPLFWWSLSGVLLVLFTVSLFPTFKEALGESLNNVPEELKALVGDSAAYSKLSGYVKLQVFDQLVFLPVILGIILGGGLLAGEEGKGTLQSLITLPVRRRTVYFQKFAALKVIVLLVTLSLPAGTFIGTLFIGESLPWLDALLATLMAFVLALVFAALAFSLGAITGRRGIAGTVAGLLAFISFLITSLAEGVKGLKYVDYMSPFHYYSQSSPLEGDISWLNAAALIAASAALFAIGLIVFVRRDIYQR